MHVTAITLGLIMATTSAAKAVHYTLPKNVKIASNCSLPLDFEVSNFVTFKSKADASLDYLHFDFVDQGTNIHTACARNSTSKASGPGENRYTCDNANVAFIYQTTGITGLTLIEKACPGGSPDQYEASGLIQPQLACSNATDAQLCFAKQPSTSGVFSSIDAAPPARPGRKARAASSIY
ncbi:hypothetical protein GGR50DRAFT_698355 [Xylaria sp. CBS 124048]|nr:hypothetical protein GGR50DRAFT_698355 [Xylaria sp. CBS 124048]